MRVYMKNYRTSIVVVGAALIGLGGTNSQAADLSGPETSTECSQTLKSAKKKARAKSNDGAVLGVHTNPVLSEVITHWYYGPNLKGSSARTQKASASGGRISRALIKKLLDWLKAEGLGINSRMHLKQSLLHVAASYNNPVLIKALLDAGASPVARDRWQQTPLHIAVQRKASLKVLSLLKDAVNKLDVYSKTPLHIAVGNADEQRVEHLIHMGADPNLPGPRKETPFAQAFNTSNLALVQTMGALGASAKVVEENGFSPLHLAVKMQSPELIKMALAAGADVNQASYNEAATALHMAAQMHDLATLEVLIEEGGNMNQPVVSGRSVWGLILPWVGLQDFVRLAMGMDVNFENVTDVLPMAIHHERGDLVDFILNNGARIDVQVSSNFHWTENNARTVETGSLLFLAVSTPYDSPEQKKAVLATLLQHMNPNELSVESKLSPLSVAAMQNDEASIELLLHGGADIDYLHPELGTALHIAVINNKNDAVARLLAHRADPNIPSPETNSTALHIAVAIDNFKAAEYILHNPSVDTSLADSNGFTAFELADKLKRHKMKVMMTHAAPSKFAEHEVMIQ